MVTWNLPALYPLTLFQSLYGIDVSTNASVYASQRLYLRAICTRRVKTTSATSPGDLYFSARTINVKSLFPFFQENANTNLRLADATTRNFLNIFWRKKIQRQLRRTSHTAKREMQRRTDEPRVCTEFSSWQKLRPAETSIHDIFYLHISKTSVVSVHRAIIIFAGERR